MPHQILAIDDSIALRMSISKTLALRADEFVVVLQKAEPPGGTRANGHAPARPAPRLAREWTGEHW